MFARSTVATSKTAGDLTRRRVHNRGKAASIPYSLRRSFYGSGFLAVLARRVVS